MIDHVLRRLIEWLRPTRLTPRLTESEAIEIARRHLMPDGQLPSPGAAPKQEGERIVWRVVTHSGYRGGHSEVYVDDENGQVTHTRHVDVHVGDD